MYQQNTEPTRWAIFSDTVCDGCTPVGRETDLDGIERWFLFDTEREAQLDLLDDLEEHIRQFREGEREFDEIDMPSSCYAQEVRVFPDGTIARVEDGRKWPAPGGNEP